MSDQTENMETQRLIRNIQSWKQKSTENEDNQKLNLENLKTLNDLENKIGSYNGKIKVLQEELELLSENIKNLKQVESNLLISHKQVSYKYLKQVENHKLCINELEKIQEMENQYNNPDKIVSLIGNWNSTGSIHHLVLSLEDYLLTKLKNNEEYGSSK